MAGSTGPDIVQDGLILAIDPANKKSFPGSGNDFYDISGNKLTGTMYNGMSASGNSIIGDDTNDYSIIPNNTLLDVYTEFSISFWLQLNSFVTHNQILGKGSGLGGTNNGWAVSSTTSGYIYFDTYSTTTRYPLIRPYNSANGVENQFGWNYVTCTFKTNDYRKMYYNGNLVVQSTAPYEIGGIQNKNFSIGGPSSWTPLNGQLSHIMYYNRQLSAEEIVKNYNQTKSRFI